MNRVREYAMNLVFESEESIDISIYPEASIWYNKETGKRDYFSFENYEEMFQEEVLAKCTEEQYVEMFIVCYEVFSELCKKHDIEWRGVYLLNNFSVARVSSAYAKDRLHGSNIGADLEFNHEQRKKLLKFILKSKAEDQSSNSAPDKWNNIIYKITGVWIGYDMTQDMSKLDPFLV